jgi:hypothetical protein
MTKLFEKPVTRGELVTCLVVCWLSLVVTLVASGTHTDELRERLDRLAAEPPCSQCGVL